MEFYLVGGAVRDQLLGLPMKDRDFVVVGASVEAMLKEHYLPVGRDFPVFLHPTTHEEYALARSERKVGTGHQGFVFHADESVTLEEDLSRRDLTINAIALDEHAKRFIDPYHGATDLKARILRHVSPAFSEDPLRILRLARFRAYLGDFDFTIAPETLALARVMVNENALAELSGERIWQEVLKALETKHPELFFKTLIDLSALHLFFPHLTELGLGALVHAKNFPPLVRFAALTFEGPGTSLAPKEFSHLSKMVQLYLETGLCFEMLSPEAKLDLLRKLDHLRRPEPFYDYLSACKAVYPHFPDAAFLKAHQTLALLNRRDIIKGLRQPEAIKQAILDAEVKALS